MRLPVDASQARPDEAITCEADQFWPHSRIDRKEAPRAIPTRGHPCGASAPYLYIISLVSIPNIGSRASHP
jgi:hypothetical protein